MRVVYNSALQPHHGYDHVGWYFAVVTPDQRTYGPYGPYSSAASARYAARAHVRKGKKPIDYVDIVQVFPKDYQYL